MSIYADIHRDLGSFRLNVKIESESRRIGILGQSGSGKSMSLRCIAGIDKPDSGLIRIDDRVLYDSENKINIKPQQRNVGYMFQNYALFPTMTVKDNIAAGLKWDKSLRKERTEEMIEKFNLAGLENRLPGELSGGQQQRVALARIMAYKPELIMLDEPFSALDTYLKDRLQHELQGMLDDYPGQVIMVSHSRDEIYRFSDEIFVLNDGNLLAEGKTKEVFAKPENIEVAKITGCKNFSKAVAVDEHTVNVIEWGITLNLPNRQVPTELKYIGYRAHYFEPVWGERQENCIKFELSGTDDLPFEKKYYIKPDGEISEETGLISWFVQGKDQAELEKKGLPDYLRLREKDVLLLI